MAHDGDREKRRGRILVLAVSGNLAIAVCKLAAAAWTGSSAMASEGVHTLVDTANEATLLYGFHRSRTPPDPSHPFGYDREVYFWSFIVALMIFALGAGFSLYEGFRGLLRPEPLRAPVVSALVLAVSAGFELVSWIPSLRELKRHRRRSRSLLAAIRESKDPSTFTVFLEDSAALVGLALAALGIGLAEWTGRPQYDAAASFAIALLLAATSLFLARESKALLIGEQAHPHLHESLVEIAGRDEAVAHVNGVLTAQLGPERVLAALSAEFHRDLTADAIEDCVRRLERVIREAHPAVYVLFVKPQPREVWEERRRALEAEGEPDFG